MSQLRSSGDTTWCQATRGGGPAYGGMEDVHTIRCGCRVTAVGTGVSVDDGIPPRPQQPIPPGRSGPVDISFATFYQGEMPYLIRVLMKCGANEQEAADAAHGAFELLLRKWDTVSKPRAWLRTVAIRQLLPAQIIKNRNSSLEDAEKYSSEISPPITAHIELREGERLALWAIRQLPPTQRKVFALCYDDFGSGEIAEILQMKPAAVRQNLARARATLKELLGLIQPPPQARQPVRESKRETS